MFRLKLTEGENGLQRWSSYPHHAFQEKTRFGENIEKDGFPAPQRRVETGRISGFQWDISLQFNLRPVCPGSVLRSTDNELLRCWRRARGLLAIGWCILLTV